jgi:hypothetical protein
VLSVERVRPMVAWRELAACAIIIVLLLVVLHIATDRRVLCEHLQVPTRLLYEQPDTVNRMMVACGFDSVHVASVTSQYGTANMSPNATG